METKENEKLLALTKLIGRKDLSFGCNLLGIDGDEYTLDNETYLSEYDNEKSIKTPGARGDTDSIQLQEIIGHSLLISDILNGLNGIKKERIGYELSDRGDLTIVTHDDSYTHYIYSGFTLDLSLPLFSQQSKEFKTFIYKVFNIK